MVALSKSMENKRLKYKELIRWLAYL